MALPTNMRYVAVSKPGGPENLEIFAGSLPSVRPGEVLIHVKAAGINRPDIAQRAGTYPPPADASLILGLEVAGEIAAVGEGVEDWNLGDRVCALTPGGGYAEFCATPSAQVLPIPGGLSFEEAACIPENYFTVWTNVFERARLVSGETFLVHGGSSGIGVTAIQLASAFGARVATTAGSSRKCEVCRELGAELTVNYREQDFVEEVKRFTNGEGVNVILDMVGGPYFARNVDCLSLEGRLSQIAIQQGPKGELSLNKLLAKRLTLMGSTLRPLPVERKGKIAAALRERVWPLFEAKRIRVVMDRVFPLEEVQSAHRLMESSEHIGKIALRV
jgi:NADPH2:quinone reductase